MLTDKLTKSSILRARKTIEPFVDATPLRRYRALEKMLGQKIRLWVKHENLAPTGSFKVRNALCAVARISQSKDVSGVIAASTGNHGIALSWAAAQFGFSAKVILNEGFEPSAYELIRALNGTPLIHGLSYDESRAFASRQARAEKSELIEATNNIGVLDGAATVALEIAEQCTFPFSIVLAIGGGSLAAGAIAVLDQWRRSDCEVFGVQAEAAPAIYRSWRSGSMVKIEPDPTMAGGLATNHPYEYTFSELRRGLSSFILVKESEIQDAALALARHTGNFVCGAGACGLAGAIKLAPDLSHRDVVVVLTGVNRNPSLISLPAEQTA